MLRDNIIILIQRTVDSTVRAGWFKQLKAYKRYIFNPIQHRVNSSRQVAIQRTVHAGCQKLSWPGQQINHKPHVQRAHVHFFLFLGNYISSIMFNSITPWLHASSRARGPPVTSRQSASDVTPIRLTAFFLPMFCMG